MVEGNWYFGACYKLLTQKTKAYGYLYGNISVSWNCFNAVSISVGKQRKVSFDL